MAEMRLDLAAAAGESSARAVEADMPQAQLEHEPAPRPQVDEQAEAASHGDDVESADQGALDADVQPTEPTHIAAPHLLHTHPGLISQGMP